MMPSAISCSMAVIPGGVEGTFIIRLGRSTRRHRRRTSAIVPSVSYARLGAGSRLTSPLSPLLANLLLDELDRELERRGHRFVRYADDCNIYVRSERAGQRVMASVTRFVERKLKLKVNARKSAVAKPQQRKFLGFSFTREAKPRRKLARQTVERTKREVRRRVRASRGRSLEQIVCDLTEYLQGWRAY